MQAKGADLAEFADLNSQVVGIPGESRDLHQRRRVALEVVLRRNRLLRNVRRSPSQNRASLQDMSCSEKALDAACLSHRHRVRVFEFVRRQVEELHAQTVSVCCLELLFRPGGSRHRAEAKSQTDAYLGP